MNAADARRINLLGNLAKLREKIDSEIAGEALIGTNFTYYYAAFHWLNIESNIDNLLLSLIQDGFKVNHRSTDNPVLFGIDIGWKEEQ